MRRAGGGAMVLVASRAAKTGVAALSANPGAAKAHYCASKAGVIALVKSLASELARPGHTGERPGPGLHRRDHDPQGAVAGHRPEAFPWAASGRPQEVAQAARVLMFRPRRRTSPATSWTSTAAPSWT